MDASAISPPGEKPRKRSIPVSASPLPLNSHGTLTLRPLHFKSKPTSQYLMGSIVTNTTQLEEIMPGYYMLEQPQATIAKVQ